MPRKYRTGPVKSDLLRRCFNEAGADAPEIPSALDGTHRDLICASMRPGRMPRKYP